MTDRRTVSRFINSVQPRRSAEDSLNGNLLHRLPRNENGSITEG